MVYKTHVCIRLTLISVSQSKNQLVISVIISKLYSLEYINEVLFCLNKIWLKFDKNDRKKRTQANKNFITFKGKKTKWK